MDMNTGRVSTPLEKEAASISSLYVALKKENQNTTRAYTDPFTGRTGELTVPGRGLLKKQPRTFLSVCFRISRSATTIVRLRDKPFKCGSVMGGRRPLCRRLRRYF